MFYKKERGTALFYVAVSLFFIRQLMRLFSGITKNRRGNTGSLTFEVFLAGSRCNSVYCGKTQYGGCVFWAEAAAEKNDGGLVSAAAAAAIRGHFGREDGQGEKAVADLGGEFFAGRYSAKTVRGHKQFHLGNDFEDNGYADGKTEGVVADIAALSAYGTYNAFGGKGNDGFVRHKEYYILGDSYKPLALAFVTAGIGKENLYWDIHLAFDSGKVGTVAQAFYAKVAHVATGRGGTAAYKGYGSIEFKTAGTKLGDLYIHAIQLLLLHAGIVHFFYLDADALGNAACAVSVYAPGADIVFILSVRIK